MFSPVAAAGIIYSFIICTGDLCSWTFGVAARKFYDLSFAPEIPVRGNSGVPTGNFPLFDPGLWDMRGGKHVQVTHLKYCCELLCVDASIKRLVKPSSRLNRPVGDP
jgi:hypothetical protein